MSDPDAEKSGCVVGSPFYPVLRHAFRQWVNVEAERIPSSTNPKRTDQMREVYKYLSRETEVGINSESVQYVCTKKIRKESLVRVIREISKINVQRVEKPSNRKTTKSDTFSYFFFVLCISPHQGKGKFLSYGKYPFF